MESRVGWEKKERRVSEMVVVVEEEEEEEEEVEEEEEEEEEEESCISAFHASLRGKEYTSEGTEYVDRTYTRFPDVTLSPDKTSNCTIEYASLMYLSIPVR